MNKKLGFIFAAFPPQFLPGTNFLPGIQNSSLSEPSGFHLRTTGLDSYQYSNNTVILYAAQCKNDNTAFHRSSAVSGGLALLRTFCQCYSDRQLD